MSELDDYLTFAKQLADEAGKVMLHYSGLDGIALDSKADDSHLTIADTEINSLVIERIKAKFPDHGVLGEEETFNLESNLLWTVDPIDGTTMFMRGIPESVFALALLEDGQPRVAVIFNPVTKQLWWAAEGQGAYLNGKKLDINNYQHDDHKIISADVMDGEPWANYAKGNMGSLDVEKLKAAKVHIKLFPVALASAMVASGSLDGSMTSCSTAWDLSAGGLIAMEAGAKATDMNGDELERWDKNTNGFCVAPPKFHEFLLTVPTNKKTT